MVVFSSFFDILIEFLVVVSIFWPVHYVHKSQIGAMEAIFTGTQENETEEK